MTLRNIVTIKPIGEEGLLALNVENIKKIAVTNGLYLSASELSELEKFIIESDFCRQFNDYVLKVIKIDTSKENGAGLTEVEKKHFNQLINSSHANKPTQADQLSEFKVKISHLRENNLVISKYSNIIRLYKAYINVLKNAESWNAELAKIKQEWDLQSRFACCNSHELFSHYELYQNAAITIDNFLKICTSPKSILSDNVRASLSHYCHFIAQQTRVFRYQIINSMLLRLQLADKYHDIHYDDVVHNFIETIERIQGRRVIKEDINKLEVFDLLRIRRRRGLPFKHVKDFVVCIQAYCDDLAGIDEQQAQRKRSIKIAFNRLSLRTPPIELCPDGQTTFDPDPILFFLFAHFEAIKDRICTLIKTDIEAAQEAINELFSLLRQGVQAYDQNVALNRKNKNVFVEGKLKQYQAECKRLANHCLQGMVDQVERETVSVLMEAEAGRLRALESLFIYKQQVTQFQHQYQDLLDEKDLILPNDLLFQLVRHIKEHDHLLKSAKFREVAAQLIAQHCCWPLVKENKNEYETTRRALTSAFEGLANNYAKRIVLDGKYRDINLMLFYLESELPSAAYPIARYRQIAIYCQQPWLDREPPKALQQKRFVVLNQGVLSEIEDGIAYILNVVIPYINVSPFISLLNLNKTDRYIIVKNHVVELIQSLKNKIATERKEKKQTDETLATLDNLQNYCDTELNNINQEWQKCLYLNIHVKTSDNELLDYLSDSKNVIDIKKLTHLLNKISHVFNSSQYQSYLFERIANLCAKLLLKSGLVALKNNLQSSELHNFIEAITQISFVPKFGTRVLRKVVDDNDVSALILRHLDLFDGSNEMIGSLISALSPIDAPVDASFIEKYIVPYAVKRLDYLHSHPEAEVCDNDVMFFDTYANVAACMAIFNRHKSNYESQVIEKLKKNPNNRWKASTAKEFELFGDEDDRSWYRSLCLMQLLTKESVGADDLALLGEFTNSIYRQDAALVNKDLYVAQEHMSFGYFVENLIDNKPWNEIRDRVIALFGPAFSQLYHLRCAYQFLNNRTPLFGPWVKAQLEVGHPHEFFGREGSSTLAKDILARLDAAQEACRDFNLSEAECQSILNLLANLAYLAVFFRKQDDNDGYQFSSELAQMERTIKLVQLTKKLLGFFTAKGDAVDYDERSIQALLQQLNMIFHEVENNDLILLNNVNSYLAFLAKVISNIEVTNLDSLKDNSIAAFLNFYLDFKEHLQHVIIILSKSPLINNVDRAALLALVKCIDSNDNMEAEKDRIIGMLDSVEDLQETIETFCVLALRINHNLQLINQCFQKRLLNEAKVKTINENPVRLAIICVNRLNQIEIKSGYSNAFYKQLITTMQSALQCIKMEDICEFTNYFLPSIANITNRLKLANRSEVSLLALHSVVATQSAPNDPAFDNFVTSFHNKYISYLLIKKMGEYIASKAGLKQHYQPSQLQLIMNRFQLTPKPQRQAFIAQELNISGDHNIRKIEFLLDLCDHVALIYSERFKRNTAIAMLNSMQNDIHKREQAGQHSYYKAKEFSGLLTELITIAESHTLQEIAVLKDGGLRRATRA